MKALTLWQPHGSAIQLGLKRYETRGWKTAYRGPLVIHAAKKYFRERDYDFIYFHEALGRLRAAGLQSWEIPYGCALCVVEVVDCVPTGALRGKIGDYEFWGDFRDRGDDGKDRYALVLSSVKPLKTPAKFPGGRLFFDIPDDILQF